MYDLLLIL